MRKYGEVLDYRTKDKAVVGKRYVFGNCLAQLQIAPEGYKVCELSKVSEHFSPFTSSTGYNFQFCREVIEEEDRMTNRQLSVWLAKGNGQKAYLKNADVPEEGFGLGVVSTCYEYVGIKDDEPCYGAIRIRSWDSDEWVVPTVEIYERDCKREIKGN